MIEVRPFDLPLRDSFGLSRGSLQTAQNVLIRIQAEGAVGLGEAAPNRRYRETQHGAVSELNGLGGRLLDDATFNAKEILATGQLEALSVSSSAKAALDMALWDWLGRFQSKPVCGLLALKRRRTPVTSFTIGLAAPDEMGRRALAAAEYPVLKVKLGGPDDRAVIEAIRKMTDRPIRIDVNEGWQDREAAARTAEWLASKNVELIEQPFPASQAADTRWLRERTELPIIGDESFSGQRPFDAVDGVFDGVNIKIDKCGGISAGRQLIQQARRRGLKVMVGCMVSSSISITAAAHLGIEADFVDLDGHLLLENDPFQGAVLDEKGRLVLSDEPGLGVSARDETFW